MSKGNIRVVARIKARPDAVDAMKALLGDLIDPTREEPGCISYQLLQNRADPTDFTFVEEWANEAVFDGHLSSAHVGKALSRLPELAAADPDIRRYDSVA